MFQFRSLIGFVAVALTALLAACATTPQASAEPRASVALAPPAELDRYQTFAFVEPASKDPALYTSLLAQRLQQSARAELEKQGYRYSELDPDLRVNLLVVVENRPEIRYFAFTRRWPYAPEVGTYRHGQLGIDLVDARRNAVVWQGAAHGRLDEQAAQDPGYAAERAVKQIFAAFPQ